MAKRTQAKLERTLEFIEGERGLQRKENPLPPALMQQMICRVCRNSIPVGKGTISYYHAECRKYRHQVNKSTIVSSRKVKLTA